MTMAKKNIIQYTVIIVGNYASMVLLVYTMALTPLSVEPVLYENGQVYHQVCMTVQEV